MESHRKLAVLLRRGATRSVEWPRGVVLQGLALLFALLLVPAAVAQEPAPEKPDAEMPAKKRTEPKGRLPTYFGEVVSAEQRERIYAIQSKYSAEIRKLEQQIAEFEANRDKEVTEVLTAEQLAKVKQLQDEAKAKRAEGAKRKKIAAATPAEAEKP